MAYIGKTPTIGNFQVCDAISVVNGQAAYTMQVSSTNVSPETANHMIVSLNGILQKPGSSFTVAGSTITFASNLATGDVIDFIIILGNVLDLGVPSDDTVGAAQIKNDLISGTTALASEPADTDEFLVSDAGTLKRMDYSYIKASAGLVKLLSTSGTNAATVDISSTYITSTYDHYRIYFSGKAATDNTGLQIQLSTNNGSSYETSGYSFSVSDIGQGNQNATTAGSQLQFTNQAYIGNDTNEGFNCVFDLLSPNSTTVATMILSSIGGADNGDAFFYQTAMGRRNDGTQAHNALKIFQSSGNYASYAIQVYGVLK